jgi:hypothetical protein
MKPATPSLLGAGGLIPFFILALAAVFAGAAWQEQATEALVAYGAVILAFLGGVSWGTALNARSGRLYLLSMVPFFAAWSALLIPRGPGIWLLAAAFTVTLANDHAAYRLGLVPHWFLRLRRVLTALVVVSLLLVALFGPPAA